MSPWCWVPSLLLNPRMSTDKQSGHQGKGRGTLRCCHAEMLLNSPQKTKLKLGKSLPLGVETAGSSANRSLQRSFRKGERREPSWAGGCSARQDRGASGVFMSPPPSLCLS